MATNPAGPIGVPNHVRDLFQADVRRIASPTPGSDLIQLGFDEGGTFVVGTEGMVWWLANDPGDGGRFVNSTTSLFSEFLSIVGPLRDRVTELTDEIAIDEVRAAREKLRSKDAAAFTSADSWWSVVLEQVEGGLL